jgi:molybdenum cofactor biosynthesis enzyme
MIVFSGITVIRMDDLATGTMIVSPDIYDMIKGKEADPQVISAVRRTAEKVEELLKGARKP